MILSEALNETLANDIRGVRALVFANLARTPGRRPRYVGQTGSLVRRMRHHTIHQLVREDMEYVVRRTLVDNGFPGFLR